MTSDPRSTLMTQHHKIRRRRAAASALSLIFPLAFGAAAHAEDAFDLDALIAAAKKEPAQPAAKKTAAKKVAAGA